jgi:streptomycin 6-kinase
VPVEDTLAPTREFAAYIERAHPTVGEQWLRSLPALRSRLAREWELSSLEPLGTGRSYVLKGHAPAFGPVVLKIPPVPSDTESERLALEYWDGAGAARLLGADSASGALLTSRIEGVPLSVEAFGEDALKHGVALLERLHRPRAAGVPRLPSLEEKLAPLRRARRAAGGPGLSAATLRGEEAVREWLAAAADREPQVVLHGDIRPANVLVGTSGTATAIDPFGILGDRARDAACLALWLGEGRHGFSHATAVADLLGLEHERVLAHAYLLAVGAWLFRATYGVSRGLHALKAFVDEFERTTLLRLV